MAWTLPRPPRLRVRTVLLHGFLLYLLIGGVRLFVVDFYQVPTSSMRPTFDPGDVIIVDRLAYGPNSFAPGLSMDLAGDLSWDLPDRGDVIVFRLPTQPDIVMVKRVIGLPGETIAAGQNGAVSIDGSPVKTHFTAVQSARQCFYDARCHDIRAFEESDPDTDPVVVQISDDHMFVLGDNRPGSIDSRNGWLVPRGAVLGRVIGHGNECDEAGIATLMTCIVSLKIIR